MIRRPCYRQGKQRCLLDRCRGYLVQATPEEEVRQEVLDWLIDEQGVPADRLRSEFNHRRRGGRGRSDIVILAPGQDEDGEVLAVVECKRRGVLLDDRAVEQGISYAGELNAPVVMVSSGDRTIAFEEQGGAWHPLEQVPDWESLLCGDLGAWQEPEPFSRWDWARIREPAAALRLARQEHLYDSIIGVDSPSALAPFSLNLFGLLADDSNGPDLPFESGGVEVLEDLGRRARRFSNSAGGGFDSEFYRSFLVLDHSQRSHQVVSLTLAALMKTTNHKLWGNRTGGTVLVVAVDGPISHVSLEMRLDDAFDLETREAWVEVSHSGALTTGKRGATKRSVVREWMERLGSGDLVQGERIVLGTLPLKREMTWKNSMGVVANLIRYALVRDRIRARLKPRNPGVGAPLTASRNLPGGTVLKGQRSVRYPG